jgi:hypothetical protein
VSFVAGDRVSVRAADGGQRVGLVTWRRLLRNESTGQVRELFEVALFDGSVLRGVPAGSLTARPWAPAERERAAREVVERVAAGALGPGGAVADEGQRREAAGVWVAICELLRQRGLAFGEGGAVEVPEDLVRLCLKAVLDRDVATPLSEVDEGPEWLLDQPQ